MSATTDPLQSYLLSVFAARKGQNNAYSLRAFARDLRVSPASLSQVMSGKRRFSRKNITEVAKRLELTSQQARFLFSMSLADIYGADGFTTLTNDQFHLVSDWYCIAILNLAKLKSHRAEPQWIAKRLGISAAEAKCGLERLKRQGLLTVKSGKLVRLAKSLSTTREIPSEAIRKYHRANLKNAERAMDSLPVHLRELCAVTIAVHPTDLARAKEFINRFKREFAKTFESPDPKEIYTLAIQFFPLTKEVPE